MARLAGSFHVIHRRFELRRVQRFYLRGLNQLASHPLQLAGKVLEPRLAFPDRRAGAAITAVGHRRKVLPGLVRQGVELHCALGELVAIERQAATQHATEVFAGLEHVLEDRLALAQRRVGVNAVTGAQGKGGEQYYGQSLEHHGLFGQQKTGRQYRRPLAKDQ